MTQKTVWSLPGVSVASTDFLELILEVGTNSCRVWYPSTSLLSLPTCNYVVISSKGYAIDMPHASTPTGPNWDLSELNEEEVAVIAYSQQSMIGVAVALLLA